MTTEKINLIGVPIAKINGRKLPTIKEVLLLFFYHHKVLHLKVNESAKKTANIVQDCWKNLQILTSGLRNTINKILEFFKKWQLLQCNKKRIKSQAQKQKEVSFETKIQQLFNIAGKNGLRSLNGEINNFSAQKLLNQPEISDNSSSPETSRKYVEIMETDEIEIDLVNDNNNNEITPSQELLTSSQSTISQISNVSDFETELLSEKKYQK
ncbi:uncharacterized protein LOC123274232 [Cotesia glomerata]|uniref:uncharacterized protein LOC123274232 n=1 Tax=Cotesia glomerata TaxID=32391 RepID=UPI001D012C0E|nr:uncharacterized protein LOC123274232 [Cotesia glomerata]